MGGGGRRTLFPTLFPLHPLSPHTHFSPALSSQDYDYMVKAAVRSAVSMGTMKPYCIFSGDTSSTIYK